MAHARGAGARGVFEGYGTAAQVTTATFLAKGVQTPVFVRLSTVLGSHGSVARRTRGGWGKRQASVPVKALLVPMGG